MLRDLLKLCVHFELLSTNVILPLFLKCMPLLRVSERRASSAGLTRSALL